MNLYRFQNHNYLLVGTLKDGALATVQQYETGAESFAHLFRDGIIRRHGKNIGKRSDLKFVQRVKRPKVLASSPLAVMDRMISNASPMASMLRNFADIASGKTKPEYNFWRNTGFGQNNDRIRFKGELN